MHLHVPGLGGLGRQPVQLNLPRLAELAVDDFGPHAFHSISAANHHDRGAHQHAGHENDDGRGAPEQPADDVRHRAVKA